jgi:hypothetical protein
MTHPVPHGLTKNVWHQVKVVADVLLGNVSIWLDGGLVGEYQAFDVGDQPDYFYIHAHANTWPSNIMRHYIDDVSVSMHARDIAILAVTTSKTGCLPIPTIGSDCTVNVTVTLENQGGHPESFSVTVSVGSTSIKNLTLSLSNGTTTSVSFTWNTTGFAYGNYTLVANAAQIGGEVDIEDNTYSLCWILVAIPGDVDGSGLVDIFDVVMITSIYEARIGDLQYSPNSDIDNNGIIDIFDVVACTGHYEETW